MERDELKLLRDRIEITELTAAFNRTLDDGDGDGFGATFIEDARLEAFREATGQRDELVGREAIAQMAADRPGGTTRHLTGDPVIVIEGDRATHDCTLLVLRMPLGSDSYVLGSGRYSDQLVRTPEGWKFASRKVHVRDLKAT